MAIKKHIAFLTFSIAFLVMAKQAGAQGLILNIPAAWGECPSDFDPLNIANVKPWCPNPFPPGMSQELNTCTIDKFGVPRNVQNLWCFNTYACDPNNPSSDPENGPWLSENGIVAVGTCVRSTCPGSGGWVWGPVDCAFVAYRPPPPLPPARTVYTPEQKASFKWWSDKAWWVTGYISVVTGTWCIEFQD